MRARAGSGSEAARANVRSQRHRYRHLSKLLVVLLAVGAVVACEAIAGIDDYEIGQCKGGGLCVPDAGEPDTFIPPDTGLLKPDESGVPCPGNQLPPSIRIGNVGNTFCIDTTEVTNAQYQSFLDAKVDPKNQPPTCRWNTDFEPPTIDAGVTLPVVNIDWCDALAYCTWAGKYLCGAATAGKKTGAVTVEGTSDYTTHQWMIACSNGGRLRYPYGSITTPQNCNTAEYDAGSLLPAGSIATCGGGFDGLKDFVGNAWEWYDGPCKPNPALEVDGGDGGPQGDDCWIKGGSYGNRGPEYDCRFDGTGVRRDLRTSSVGFRCCSD